MWGLLYLEFPAELAFVLVKRRYVRENWLDLLVVLLPFPRFLRLARAQSAKAWPKNPGGAYS